MRNFALILWLLPSLAWAFGTPKPLPIVDHLSSQPAVCYSVRVLERAQYGQPLLVERRSSDNTQRNIYYMPNGTIDWADEQAFAGAGNGFVVTWNNGCTLGSSGNATQSTAAKQPQIVASGVLNINGGNSFVNFGGSAWLTTSYVPSGAFTWAGVAANNRATIGSNNVVDSLIETTNSGANSGSGVDTYNGYGSTSTRQFVPDGSPSSGIIYKNGNTTPLTLAYQEKALFTFTGTGQSSTGFWIGATLDQTVIGQNQVFEILGFTSVISAANKSIYDLNQAAFYGISGVTQ